MPTPKPTPRPCLCHNAYVCHRHAAAWTEIYTLARNITVPDDVWLNALHKSFKDDLHRLLEGAT